MDNLFKNLSSNAGAPNPTGLPDPTKLAQLLNLDGINSDKNLPFDENSIQEMEKLFGNLKDLGKLNTEGNPTEPNASKGLESMF